MSLDLNLESIILLLFFIAPGFLFTRTYTAYRPRYYREPTAFEQFVLAIVGSVIIHSAIFAVIGIFSLIYWWLTGQLLYLFNFIDPAIPLNHYPMSVLAGIFFASFSYLAASLIAARRFATFLGRGTPADRPRWWRFLMGEDPPEPFLLWHTILQIEPLHADLIPPRLNIKMRTGEFFKGDLYQMRLVGDEENSVELALRNVAYHANAAIDQNYSDEALTPLDQQTVLLKSNDILWLTREDTIK